MVDENFNAVIISETHWDRAWYQTFEEFRLRLVKLVDSLLDILNNNPDFAHYTFDGQTVVLEDYLNVKPQMREMLQKLVKEGRIDVGPWYVLPDVYLVSGESLIRNLLLGRQVANEFGRCMDVGYIPDPFGHISQLPQILSQFGYDSIIFARGTGEESETLGSEFIWEASDGSEVLAHWLPLSYGNAANLPEDVQDAVYVIEDVLERLKPWSRIGTYLLMNGSDHLEPQKHLPDIIRRFNESHDDKLVIGTLPMFVKRIREEKSQLSRFSGEFRRSKYHNLLSGVYSARVYIKQANEYSQRLLERITEPWCVSAWLLGKKYPLHEIRQAWKYLLLNHPHDDICGCSIDDVHEDNMQRYRWVDEISGGLLEESYQTLIGQLQSEKPGIAILNPSPKDRSGIVIFEFPASNYRYSRLADISLIDPNLVPQSQLEAAKNEIHIAYVRQNGFDLDPTNEREIVKGSEKLREFEFDYSHLAMLDPPLRRVLRHVSTAYKIVVNSRNKVVDVWARKFDAGEDADSLLCLADQDQNPIPIQLLDYEMRKDPLNHLIADREEHLRFAVAAEDVPALGAKRYDMIFSHSESDMDISSKVMVSGNRLENEVVSVEVEENGTLTITDKRSSQIYKGVLKFEDSADSGDSYDYCPIANGTTVFENIEVEIEEGYTGPLVGSLLISGTIELPIGLNSNSIERTDEKVDCEFVTEITLTRGSPTVQVLTVFNNLAEDHRLRVLLPVGTETTECSADSTFDVLDRPNRPKQETDWAQPLAPTYPMRSFMSLGGNGRGLSVTTKGLLEFEILKPEGGTIALTLVRSVGWLSKMGFATRRGNAGPIVETPDAQCQGINTVEFAITPHTGNWLQDETYLESEEYLLPLQSLFIPKSEGNGEKTQLEGITLAPSCMRLSALKQSEDGKHGVLRFWNIADTNEVCTVKFGFDVKAVFGARMDESVENSIKPKRVGENEYTIPVPPKRVVTILFEPTR
ncbi:MAG: alpha-mannosidase [Candidatus Thorarchaeota archaeon]